MNIGQLNKEVVLTGCASEDEFIRLPREVLSKVPHLTELAGHTSGIRIRFETDSRTLRLVAENGRLSELMHMPVSGSSGFDIYSNGRFLNNIRPVYGSLEMDETVELGKGKFPRIIDIYFPLYNSVASFLFELEKGALKTKNYQMGRPVVFYGSSITQGGCASRPGNNYVNMTGRMTERPVINLGFSGSAMGEQAIAEYIGSIDMDAFVYDYDHNAPDTDHLRKTHEAFFKTIRRMKPGIPILMMTRPGYEKWKDVAKKNTGVVMTTYLNALSGGDENVYFIDGRTLFGEEDRDACSVDGTHPNDIGFMRMAKRVSAVLNEVLEDIDERKN